MALGVDAIALMFRLFVLCIRFVDSLRHKDDQNSKMGNLMLRVPTSTYVGMSARCVRGYDGCVTTL